MKGSTAIKIAVLIIAAVFLINQVVAAVYKPVTTETAEYFTATDGFKITGIIIRNEVLVKSDSSGVLHFMIEDGKRVPKDGVVANIYDNENASITLSQIDRIQKKISDIEDILSYNDIEAANIDLINSRVYNGVDELVRSVSAGNYNDASLYSEELLSSMNRRQAAMGEMGDFSAQLEVLKSQAADLLSSLPTAKGQIKAVESGYFVSNTDGYEEILGCDDLKKLTPEFLSDITAEKHSDNVVGKIVSDYEWYIAAQVSLNQSLNYKEGDNLKIYTSVKSSPVLPVTVKTINISENDSTAVIVFACNEMNSELAAMRSAPMTVVSAEYSGLKVAKKALRVVDSVRGVYVLKGMQVKFVPVNMIYSNDTYMICEKETDTDNALKLYDQVVVKGKNLYDGKVVS